VPGKFAGEDTRAAADVENPATGLWKMTKKKSRASFKGSDEVVFLRKVVEGSGIVGFQGAAPVRKKNFKSA
jgi:hypothetical protein